MFTSRKRNLIQRAGLLTAVTLSVSLLAGCNGSRFLMGGDPAPVSPAGAAVPSPKPTAEPAMVKLSGTASVLGAPLANASVKVFNAITNQPASVVAAGGGNVVAAGGGNVIAAGSGNFSVSQAGPQVGAEAFSADANGKFSISVGNVMPNDVLRVVASADGKTVTTLVTGSGKAITDVAQAAYAVSEVRSVVFEEVKINEKTHLKALIATPLLQTFVHKSVLTETIILELSMLPIKVDQFVSKTLSELTTQTRPDGSAAREQFTRALNETGLTQQVESFRQSVASRANATPSDTQSNNQPPGGIDKPGHLLPTGLDFQQDGITDNGESAGITATSTSFKPTVSASYASGTLSVTVAQPKGSDDISTIYARIPKANATLSGSLSTMTNLEAAGSQVVIEGGPTLGLTVVKDNTAAESLTSYVHRVAVTLSNPLWAGYLQRGTTKIAKFQVFENGSYYYLVTKYNLTDAATSSGGHTTTLTTASITSLAANTRMEVTMTSRKSNAVDLAATI